MVGSTMGLILTALAGRPGFAHCEIQMNDNVYRLDSSLVTVTMIPNRNNLWENSFILIHDFRRLIPLWWRNVWWSH